MTDIEISTEEIQKRVSCNPHTAKEALQWLREGLADPQGNEAFSGIFAVLDGVTSLIDLYESHELQYRDGQNKNAALVSEISRQRDYLADQLLTRRNENREDLLKRLVSNAHIELDQYEISEKDVRTFLEVMTGDNRLVSSFTISDIAGLISEVAGEVYDEQKLLADEAAEYESDGDDD